LRGISRRIAARIDDEDPPRAQTRLLLGLIHRSCHTPFGRNHDFARIRTPGDYRRLVPLSTPTAPLTACHDLAYRAAWRLALAQALHHGVPLPLASGGFVLLGERDDFAARLPYLIAPFGSRGERSPLGAGTVCLAGPLRQLLDLLPAEPDLPDLAMILYQSDTEWSVAALHARLNTRALSMEMATVLGVPVALEDTRHEMLRLLTDNGVYYEFIPQAHVHDAQPERLPLDQVKPGDTYELVLTIGADLWACRTGQLVCFDRLAPPLLALVGIVPVAPAAVSEAAVPAAPPPLPGRPRTDGIPAVPTGTFGHIPWSAPADRG
jgi:hypothetical protein